MFNNPAGTTQRPVSTPEAPLAVGLPVAAQLIVGGVVFHRSRKSRAAAAS